MKEKIPSQRRDFLKKVAIGSFGLAALPGASISFPMDLADNLTILFQGDSITDAGRDRARYYANNSAGLGNGYVTYIAGKLLGENPQKNLKCYNRGISGNKVFQLANRWDDDCLQLKPDVLSILIGVNDFWHTLSHGYSGTATTFENDLRKLLDRTRENLPDVKLIFGEPFAVKGGTAIGPQWETDFKAYQEATKEIAADYDAILVPYQKLFDDALKIAPVSYWCPDGVHPSMAGAYLMASAWLEEFTNVF